MSVRIKRPPRPFKTCPVCGMDSAEHKVSAKAWPEKHYIVCQTCGFKVGPYPDLTHAKVRWNSYARV